MYTFTSNNSNMMHIYYKRRCITIPYIYIYIYSCTYVYMYNCRCFDALVDQKYFYLEMEYCAGKDLYKYIRKCVENKCGMPIESAKYMIYNLFEVLQLFHEENIVHRDLKPENIVLKDPNNLMHFRLIDFGTTIKINPKQEYHGQSM